MSIEATTRYVKTELQLSSSVDHHHVKKIDDFLLHVDLVMEGVRAAYFFDTAVISVQKAREIICYMYSFLGSIRKVVLVMIAEDGFNSSEGGDMVAVVSPQRLCTNYDLMNFGEWSSQVMPLNIGSIAPFRCTEDMLCNIEKELLRILSPLYSVCSKCSFSPYPLQISPIASDVRIVKVCNNAEVIGKLFMQGFLEDRVCVYHLPSTLSKENQTFAVKPPHCLYLSTLKRVTLSCACRHNRYDSDGGTISSEGSDELTYLATIGEFSVPKTYLDSSLDNMILLNDLVQKKIMDLKVQSANSSLIVHFLLHQDEFVLESFAIR